MNGIHGPQRIASDGVATLWGKRATRYNDSKAAVRAIRATKVACVSWKVLSAVSENSGKVLARS